MRPLFLAGLLLLALASLALGAAVVALHRDGAPATQTVDGTTTTVPAPSERVVWSADHESGDASQWPRITKNWDDAGCAEHAVVSDGHAQSGIYSMRMTVDDTGLEKAGCRQARSVEAQTGETYIYEASYFLPRPVLTRANHWNVFQFKSECGGCSNSDPMWTIDFQGDPLRPVLAWKGGDHGLQGPFVSSGTAPREWPNHLTTVPIARWTTLSVYLDQSARHTGRITVWQDGTLIYDIDNVRTKYPSLDQRWSVNNYSNGLTVNPYTLYIDDALIRLP
jgi:Polysaccharide lyase